MITLLLGGSGSGKSLVAEALAGTLPPPVTYVATWMPSNDPDMAARVAAHRARRPSTWECCEVGERLAHALVDLRGTVLVDSLGTWVAGVDGFEVDATSLCRALRARQGDTVIVSDEVGQGVHPSSASGRAFRDALGSVNQAVAAIADDVWLVVAGRVLALGPPPWS